MCPDDDFVETREDFERAQDELAFLFGRETVEQAGQLDIADLNLSDEIAACIADGIRTLKELQDKPAAQVNFVNSLQPGARLLLCLWIMDMDLLKKIQRRSYLPESPASPGSE
ncbi:MAG: hypothetical protein OXN26_05600 [Gammaproteobacteria bacterium]|nr:hypothetical protein [Gammaproteobacteria bacterium]